MFYRVDGIDAITPQTTTQPMHGAAQSGADTTGDTYNQGTPFYDAGTQVGTYYQGGTPLNQPATGMGPMYPYQPMNPLQGMVFYCPCPMIYGMQPMQNQNMQGQTSQWQTPTTQTQGNYNRQLNILPYLFYGLADNYYGSYNGYNDYDNYDDDYEYDDIDYDDYEYYEPQTHYNSYDDEDDE